MKISVNILFSFPLLICRKYTQRTRKSWLHDVRFSKWLVSVDEHQLKCKYCKCVLKPKLSTILSHGKPSKHLVVASPLCKNQKTIKL